MGVNVRIDRANLEMANLCQEGLDVFDELTGGAAVFEAEWTNLHEIMIQQRAPWIVAWLRSKHLIPYPNFAGDDLSGIALIGADLRGACLEGCNLAGTDLTDAKLQRAVLVDADLTDTNLTNANLSRSVLTGTDLDQAVTEGTNLELAVYDGDPPVGWTSEDGMIKPE